jgi:hypothetical protein
VSAPRGCRPSRSSVPWATRPAAPASARPTVLAGQTARQAPSSCPSISALPQASTEGRMRSTISSITAPWHSRLAGTGCVPKQARSPATRSARPSPLVAHQRRPLRQGIVHGSANGTIEQCVRPCGGMSPRSTGHPATTADSRADRTPDTNRLPDPASIARRKDPALRPLPVLATLDPRQRHRQISQQSAFRRLCRRCAARRGSAFP